MRIKDIDLSKNLNRRIRITNIQGEEEEFLIGKTGTLTDKSADFPIGMCGIFLDDVSGMEQAICNLLPDDEIEFEEEV